MTSSFTLPARPSTARKALKLLRAHPRESLGAAAIAIATCGAIGAVAGTSGAVPVLPDAAAATPSVQDTTPFAVRKVAPSEALALNAAVPLASGPNPAAAPFVLKGDRQAHARALECLTQAIYYEAARESEDGQRAVAQVILNRMRHPAYPASVCGVVYQGAERPTGCQFSFTCDGSLNRVPLRDYWERARRVATDALNGHVAAAVGNATHYHANYVAPYWAPTLVKNAVIGAHIFYRWPGDWGRPGAFSQRWSRREGDPAVLRSAALAAEARHALLAPTDGTTAATMVAEAKRELPPELAKLLSAEANAKGEGRVALTFNAPRKPKPAIPPPQPLERGPTSSNLDWALSGKPAETAAQPPLGRAAVEPAPATGGATP